MSFHKVVQQMFEVQDSQILFKKMSNYALASPQADLPTILAKGSLGNHHIIQPRGWQT